LLGVLFVSFAGAVIPDDCPTTLDMVAYWQFDDNVLDSYADHDGGVWSGDELYGTLKVNKSAGFTSGDMITVPNVDASYFTSSFTTEMWVRGSGMGATGLFKKGGYEIEWVFDTPPTALINVTINDVSIISDSFPSADPHHVALCFGECGEGLL